MINYLDIMNKHDSNIYNLILNKFINEDNTNEDEHNKAEYKKNAGGYTSGVLIDF